MPGEQPANADAAQPAGGSPTGSSADAPPASGRAAITVASPFDVATASPKAADGAAAAMGRASSKLHGRSSWRELDVEGLGPELSGLRQSMSTQEIRVLSRLCSGAAGPRQRQATGRTGERRSPAGGCRSSADPAPVSPLSPCSQPRLCAAQAQAPCQPAALGVGVVRARWLRGAVGSACRRRAGASQGLAADACARPLPHGRPPRAAAPPCPPPPARCRWVFYLLPGMGMFSEAYFIFAIVRRSCALCPPLLLLLLLPLLLQLLLLP